MNLTDITNGNEIHATRSTEPTIMDMVSMVNDLVGNLSNSGWAAAEHQIGIIESELNELKEAIVARDLDEVRDGIVDVIFTANGMAHRLGIDANADFDDMMISQMTKFDPTEEAAMVTGTKYLDKGMVVEPVKRTHPMTGEVLYVTMSAADQQDDKGRFCPKGKWLKSYNFQEPVFRPLPQEVLAKLEETK